MGKKKRIAAAFLAVTILLVLLFSAAFIAAEADHDCAGEKLPDLRSDHRLPKHSEGLFPYCMHRSLSCGV